MKKIVRLVVFLALFTIVGFTLYNVFLFKPEVSGLKQLEKLPRSKEVKLYIDPPPRSGEISVIAIQGGKEFTLFKDILRENIHEVSFKVEPRKVGLSDGDAKVVVEIKRFFVLKDRYEVKAKVDTVPPRLKVLFYTSNILQGGSGGVKVNLKEKASLKLEVGDRIFKSYPLSDRVQVILFAVPRNFKGKTVKLVAEDEVGNVSTVLLKVNVRRNRFKTFRIEISKMEESLRAKALEILGYDEAIPLPDLFKKINEDLRRENENQIRKIGQRSVGEKLWQGHFLQLKNSKVISLFGEKRIYTYRGKFVSESVHLGYDLASVRNAPIPASNSGVVVFAGDLGIYGNTVIIDHGFGLMSLYAHLADYDVKEGQKVNKGQIIGFTDTTGLAFGDHLHFGILIQGYEVTPLEWWDPKWIKTRIEPLFQ